MSSLSFKPSYDKKIIASEDQKVPRWRNKTLRKVPKNAAGFETAKQLIKAAGSVGANYRASVRAKSSDDFIYKIEVVLEEADESHYWLEVVRDAKLQEGKELDRLISEANELTAIFSATDKTNKAKRNKR